MKRNRLTRRRFLELSALSVGALGLHSPALSASADQAISLVSDPDDPISASQPVAWARQELSAAVSQTGTAVRRFSSIAQATRSDRTIVIAGARSAFAVQALKDVGVAPPSGPESLAVVPSKYKDRPVLLVCGADARGLMYAVLELADRVRHGENPIDVVTHQKTVERPFNQVRSIGRLFVSDVQDKSWFNDREMWPAYFSMLATQRINRFSLNLGIGFDFLQNVTDSYFLFAYPFLLQVPGYDVRAVNLPETERDHNLEMLQFISREAVTHGIDFQLGIWTHGYQWTDTPQSNYTISGLTPENHAAYSREALATLLRACPNISGITLRTHGESGVREGSYDFWRTVFDGVPKSGRRVEIDLHPKGLDQKMIDSALATGMPVRLSPKYWAEHMGLPYQQTAIRELEMPHETSKDGTFFTLSTGSRIFTRYGYADFLREDRPYSLIYRIWPGTHRFLLWGDPVSTAAHARAFQFCGSNGVELYEPLSFKGRRGSGLPGSRCAYADASLNPVRDWEKYLYTYRVWGRLLYNPDADPHVWRRQLRRDFSDRATALETALGAATRIASLVTTAHLPSAANDTYGPEFYTNQSIVDAAKYSPYGDTPAPKVFGNVSPLDPELFARTNDFAAELLKGEHGAKYSPIEVAQWLENLAEVAATQLAEAQKANARKTPEFRRLLADVGIQIGIGRFFAAKLRAATLYAIYEQSGDRAALGEAIKMYRQARDTWVDFTSQAAGVYVKDITYGPRPYQRGHWSDRLAAIEDDIAEMAKRLEGLPPAPESSDTGHVAIGEALGQPRREVIQCNHVPPADFIPNQELPIVLTIPQARGPSSVLLRYRHVNQAERYQSLEMQLEGGKAQATIPASYTDSPFPLQYYFEFRRNGRAGLYPGLGPELANQPYFVIRGQRTAPRHE
ncbi:MAG TPA: hypothetical protein VFM77_09380 [Terriglobales bacterium]|nr:hypothetical protein [Terriglobales bacterium]